jgi:phosphomannomutase
LRSSNTEPLLRLNVESRDNAALVQARVHEVETVIGVNV